MPEVGLEATEWFKSHTTHDYHWLLLSWKQSTSLANVFLYGTGEL